MSQGWLKWYLDHGSLVCSGLAAMATVLFKKKDVQGDCSFPTYLEDIVLVEHEGTIKCNKYKMSFLLHNLV